MVDPKLDVLPENVARDKLKKEVVEAARRVFMKHGKNGARTSRIAEEAQIKESTLWTLFSSKEEIFSAAVFDELERHLTATFERYAAVASSENPDWYAALLEAEVAGLEMMQEWVVLLGVAIFSEPDLGKVYYQTRLVPLFEQLNRNLNTVLPKPRGDREAWYDLLISWGMLFGIGVTSRVAHESEQDRVEIAESLARQRYRFRFSPKS
ncbi:MAG: TetR/AcrR family transcriptional regulator [Acidimicrobiales bacterium]